MPLISPLPDRSPTPTSASKPSTRSVRLARGPEGVDDAKARLLARAQGRGNAARPRRRRRDARTAAVHRPPQTLQRGRGRHRPPSCRRHADRRGRESRRGAGAVEGLEALVRQSGKLAPTPRTHRAASRAATHRGPRAGRRASSRASAGWRRLALTPPGVAERSLLEAGIADPDDEVRRLTMIAARAEIEGREAVLTKGLADARGARAIRGAADVGPRVSEGVLCARFLPRSATRIRTSRCWPSICSATAVPRQRRRRE